MKTLTSCDDDNEPTMFDQTKTGKGWGSGEYTVLSSH